MHHFYTRSFIRGCYVYQMNRVAAIILISFLLNGCGGSSSQSLASSEVIDPSLLHPTIKTIYDDLSQQMMCDTPRICNSIIQLSCVPEVDGPESYYDNFTGDSIMFCGGACLVVDPDNPKDCKKCPPTEWSCK